MHLFPEKREAVAEAEYGLEWSRLQRMQIIAAAPFNSYWIPCVVVLFCFFPFRSLGARCWLLSAAKYAQQHSQYFFQFYWNSNKNQSHAHRGVGTSVRRTALSMTQRSKWKWKWMVWVFGSCTQPTSARAKRAAAAMFAADAVRWNIWMKSNMWRILFLV